MWQFALIALVLTAAGAAFDQAWLTYSGMAVLAFGVLAMGTVIVLRWRMHRLFTRLSASAELGDPSAMRYRGLLHHLHDQSDRALSWLMRALEAGDPVAPFHIGSIIKKRDGLAAAEPWFRMAADNGDPVAMKMFAPGGEYHPRK